NNNLVFFGNVAGLPLYRAHPQFKIQHTKQKPHSFAGNAAWGIEMKWCFYSAQVSTTLPD
ncbi:MAG: hypothetical protein IKY91_04440, partial [Akkermansia sp.]|nr:hypothetical protein [Akkermansia sp.]